MCDVAVIGGGPAGCVFAIRMTQLGYTVCLIERSRFPRAHLGESLSPGVLPMLASIECADVIEALSFARVSRVRTNWEGAFTERVDPRQEGMLVDRGAFDAALLKRAADVGVRVFQPAQLVSCSARPEGWHLIIDSAGREIELRAHFVGDATGRAGRLGGARTSAGARTVSLYGYWTGSGLPGAPRIEATDEAWYWGVPIPDGSYNTLVFLDADRARGDATQSLDDRLRELLSRSSLLDDVVGGSLRAPARAADATAYVNTDCVSPRSISIGDAAVAIDPLSSSGVQKAIQSALSGAIVANTMLQKPEMTDAARQFYLSSITGVSERHKAWAAQFYSGPAARFRTPFWTARSAGSATPERLPILAANVPLELARDVQLLEQPCLGSQFVELRTALVAPLVDGPVAYLGGHELAPLIRQHRPGMSAHDLVRQWSADTPEQSGAAIARWLIEHGVLRRAQDAMIGA